MHLTFVPIDFIVMDMKNNSPCPIIPGRPFLRKIGAFIDSNKGNVSLGSQKRSA